MSQSTQVFSDFGCVGDIIAKLNGIPKEGGNIHVSPEERSLLLDLLPVLSKRTLPEIALLSASSRPFSHGFDSLEKIRLLEQEANINGFCFLWTMLYVREFSGVSFQVFERCLHAFKGMYGQDGQWPREPLGKDVFVSLAVFKLSLQGVDISDSHNVPHHLLSDAISDIMNSGVPMRFSSESDVIHLERSTLDPCGCSEVMCQHGWSSRFIVTAGSSFGKRIGATVIDLSDVFGLQESVEEDFSTAPLKLNSGFRVENFLRSGVSENSTHQPAKVKLSSSDEGLGQSSKTGHRLPYDELSARYRDVQKELECLSKERARRWKSGGLNGIPEIDETGPSREIPATENATTINLGPDDSSSNIGRYERPGGQGYMAEGTVFTVRRPSVLGTGEESLVQYTPLVVPNVVQGFVNTERLMNLDRTSRSKVRPINGLCNPFRNNRLNFLMHFFSAMDLLSEICPGDLSPYILLKNCRTLTGRTPTLELMVMVVERTFDGNDEVVSSNPFNLPYLEIGMQLSDDSVVKSLSLLLKEYEITWFQEMKALKMPRFHKTFSGLSTEKLSKGSKSSHGRKERSGSTSSSDKGKRASSIFSINH